VLTKNIPEQLAVILLLIMISCGPVLAADTDTAKTDNTDEPVVKLEEEVVTGESQGQASDGYRYKSNDVGVFKDVPLSETPLSTQVVSGELIENSCAHNPTDALKKLATVAPLMSSGGYSSMHRVMIRGFNASDQNDLRNGLVDRSFTLPPMEDIDRIEVLNGVSGFLYGFSAIGGAVNYVTKSPSNTFLGALSTGVYSGGLFYGHADLGGPMIKDKLTYRLNVYAEDGETYIDGAEQDRQLVSGSLAYQMTDKIRLNLDFYHQELDNTGLQTYFNIADIGYQVPDADLFDATKQYGESWTFNEASKTVVDFGIYADITESLAFRGAFRVGEMDRKYSFVGAVLTDTDGNYTKTMVSSAGNDESTTAAYALMDAKLTTAGVEHQLTFGYTHCGFEFERGTNYVDSLGTSSINSITYYDSTGQATGYDRRMKSQTHNLILGDRIVFSPVFSVMAGINYSQLDVKYYGLYDTDPNKDSHVTQDAFIPMLGIVYKPIPTVSVYASYMQAVENGGIATAGAANAYEAMDPYVSDQYEAGVKATVWNRLDLGATVFRIEKANQYLDSSDNVYKQDGLQVHQGFELTATGRLTDSLTVIAGWTPMSAEVKEADDAATEGQTPVNVAEDQARLYLEYRLPTFLGSAHQFTVVGGANYYGKRPVTIPNTQYLPSVTTYDAGLRYQYKDKVTVNLNVANLTDESYWSYYRDGSDGITGGDGLLLGDPRTISFSVKYMF